MRLAKVRLQNFRQHVDTTINFRPGITGIIGPNGAGKSTILEAIAWAVYGTVASRGKNDSIRFARAAPRARVIVELVFQLGGHEYRVVRTLQGAEVYLDNSLNPVASGNRPTTAYLQNKLGMSFEEFSNTYFTGQKKLHFLDNMGAADRGRFLAQVLGYERLRRAQEIAKDRTRELRAEINGLKTGLPDPGLLKADSELAAARLKEAKKTAAALLKKLEALQKDVARITPEWEAAQQTREQAGKLTFELQAIGHEIGTAERDVQRAADELKKIAEAEQQLTALKPRLDELVEVAAAIEQQNILAQVHARRSVLEENERRQVAELEKLEKILEGLKQAPALLVKAREELAEIKKALPLASEKRDKLLAEYQKDVQDNRAELRFALTQVQEIEAQIARLQAAGETGSCPICTKPLGDEYGTVLEHLQLELEDRRGIIKWRNARDKQLAKKPDALVAAEAEVAQLQAAHEKKTEREARCAQGVKDLWERGEEKQARDKQLAAARAELAAMPNSYDKASHQQLADRHRELQQFAHQASVFEHVIASRVVREAEFKTAQQRHAELTARQAELAAALKQLGFDEQAFQKLHAKHEKLAAEVQAAKIAGAEAGSALAAAEEAVANAQRAQAAYDEKKQKLLTLEADLRHHDAMDGALTQLRTELNARVRPELAELASAFLSDITNGRYNAIDIDENYVVTVVEDGEEKPVISGGEEDVANLVLRIAISQMIADRAGHQLSALFLDEVFGSLDIERRDNVIQLLQQLQDRFEQVILITHIETVREGLDHVIRLSYDERTGSTVVRTEEPVQAELLEV